MPFAGYKNFDACVRANRSKKNPKAYCATIMRAVEEGQELSDRAREVLDVSEAEFNKDETTGKMMAHVRIIRAGKAKGKDRRYTTESIRKAAREGVYDGMRMYVNHSDKPPTKRGMSELVSAVESTSYDPKTDSVMADVEFFDEKFFDYAQRARKHIGLSADHRIRVNYVQEGQHRIEQVQEIPFARSVDWVIYPAAGGEIISFAKESEGADQVEWSDVTLEDLKANAPDLLKAARAEFAKEAAGPDDEPDDDPEEGATKNKGAQESFTREDVAKMVQEQVKEIQDAAAADNRKRTETGKKVRELVSKSGLPSRTQSRLINLFADATEYVEDDVKAQIEDAKAEIAEVRPPRISGMGPSGAQAKEGEQAQSYGVRESVEELFMGNKKKATTGASGKES